VAPFVYTNVEGMRCQHHKLLSELLYCGASLS